MPRTPTVSRGIAQEPQGLQPVWEIAELFPPQGCWDEDDYVSLTDFLEPHPIVEFCAGRVDVLPVPTEWHQFIMQFFFGKLQDHCANKGTVMISGMRIRIGKKRGNRPIYRGPDVMFMKKENAQRRHEKYWDGADLVAEVVSGSPEDRHRDYATKRRAYAAAGIAEYWIIDCQDQLIRVLTLKARSYRLRGDFKTGSIATSALLPGHPLVVDDVLAAAKGI